MLGSPDSKYYSVHAHPRGINDARPTALGIIHDECLEGKWADKVALVTGGNSTLGYEITRALHATGATVWITARTLTAGNAAVAAIRRSDTGKSAPLHVLEMRLDDPDSVRAAADCFLSQAANRLNVLVCNAGVKTVPSSNASATADTEANVFQKRDPYLTVNYLGHFLLFTQLRPALRDSSAPDFASRVVMVSDDAHRLGAFNFDDPHYANSNYQSKEAYARSKTALLWMANSIERRYGGNSNNKNSNSGNGNGKGMNAVGAIHALSVHPGTIRRDRTCHVQIPDETENSRDQPNSVAREKSPAQGAATVIYAAVAKEWEGRGGRYLSNCMEMKKARTNPTLNVMDEGYAEWAYDTEKEDRLWDWTVKELGLDEKDGSL